MKRDYQKEMQDVRENLLQEIIAILDGCKDGEYEFKDPFYTHWADGDCSGMDVCYYIKKDEGDARIRVGYGNSDSKEAEDECLVSATADHTTESLIEILRRLEEETKEKVLRITFVSEVFIKGESIGEIKEKFEALPIFSADALESAFAEFVEISAVEDEKHKDCLCEFNEA